MSSPSPGSGSSAVSTGLEAKESVPIGDSVCGRRRLPKRGPIEILKGRRVVVVVGAVDRSSGGRMVVQPFTESQFTLILPPRSMASCRSVGGATPGGMFRLIA